MNKLSHPEHYQPTAEEMAEASYYFARMEYEQRPFTVRCASCGTEATDSQMNLEQIGWTLSTKGEYCPADKPEVALQGVAI